MKPARSPITTGTLSRVAANSFASSTTSCSVTTVRTSSTSFCTGAGLKKCIPITLPGRPVRTASSVTDSDDVLDARMTSGRHTSSSSANTAALRSRCSGTASITRSASAMSASDVVVDDPAEQLVGAGLGQLAALDRPRRRRLQVCAPAQHRVVVDLGGDHLQAVAGEDLDDARTHRAQADHPDRPELACHPPTSRCAARPRPDRPISAHGSRARVPVTATSRAAAARHPGAPSSHRTCAGSW